MEIAADSSCKIAASVQVCQMKKTDLQRRLAAHATIDEFDNKVADDRHNDAWYFSLQESDI